MTRAQAENKTRSDYRHHEAAKQGNPDALINLGVGKGISGIYNERDDCDGKSTKSYFA